MNSFFRIKLLNTGDGLYSNCHVNERLRGEQSVCQKIFRNVLVVSFFVLVALTSFAQAVNSNYRSKTSGNWSNLSTWERFNGSTWLDPTDLQGYPGQNAGTGSVIIRDGHAVTIDCSASWPVQSLSVGGGVSGILQYDELTERTLTVSEIVSINRNGILRSADPLSGSTIRTHLFVVNGSMINNGTIDFCINSSGAAIQFTGAGGGNSTFNCQSATAHTNLLMSTGINLDMVNASSVLLFYPGRDFRVESDPGKGFLKITKGIFKIPSGKFAFTNPIFNEANYVIPEGGGFELSNPKATVTGQSGSVDNRGMIRITAGTWNLGNAPGNSLLTHNKGHFELSGGVVNIAGSFALSDATGNLKGGILNLSVLAPASPTEASFSCDPASTLTVSGTPLISLAIPNPEGSNDIEIRSGTGKKVV